MPFRRGCDFFFEQPHDHMVVHDGRHLETVGTTPKQRRSNMAVDRSEPPPPHGRHPPIRGVAHRQSTAVPHKRAVGGRTADRATAMAVDLPEAWNRIKAPLSVFQRREIKVLGFGVKARPRPQRMALRGIRALTSRCEPAEDATTVHDRHTASDRGLRSH